MTIGAVLPVKDTGDAKQRLAGFLSAAERRCLALTMAEDVLETLSRVAGLSEIVVVTRDQRAAALAARHGARVLAEPSNDGQSAAVERASASLSRVGVDSLLQVPGDVPGANVAEIEAVLAAHEDAGGDGPAVTLVPSHDRRGTNCVLCSPPGVLPFAFGHDSFGPHCEAARALGIAARILPLPGLGLDIDTPDDLRAFIARPAAGRTLDYLRESGIAERLLVTDAA
ncbi:MAG: 2-phospho-L-lactate guanylyltransferase [Rhodospirillaceae bacterium]|nr:2-phospho-L-lactate guanylyltransferase [Rhodospirillaceae bacterium]